jgi:hypothetical protein
MVLYNASFNSSHIVFNGTNLYLHGFTPKASYAGIEADEVIFIPKDYSASSYSGRRLQDTAAILEESSYNGTVAAYWKLGLPPTGMQLYPKLWYVNESSNLTHYAHMDFVVGLDLNVTGMFQNMTCSFAGGCMLEVMSNGLSSVLNNDTENNFISVCDELCEF